MPQLIQSSPQGILDLLGVNLGDHPRLMADELRPIVDFTRFYLEPFYDEKQDVATAVSAPGNGAALTIPPRELWVVHMLGGEAQTPSAVGTQMKISVSFRPAPILAPIQLGQSETLTSGLANERIGVGVQFPGGFVAGAGTTFFGTVLVDPTGANTYDLVLNALVSVLRI